MGTLPDFKSDSYLGAAKSYNLFVQVTNDGQNANRLVGLLLAAVAVVTCGRSELAPLPPPLITVDVPRIVNADDNALVTGSCSDGLPVQCADAAPVPCEGGRFAFETPIADTDGIRIYVLFQARGQMTSEATLTWVRNAEPPVLSLDEVTIVNGLDSAVFRGSCTSLAGVVQVSPSNVDVACIGDRFVFATPPAMTDATRLYTFTQTNAAAVMSEVVGTWVRNATLPRLVLDAELIANGDDTAVFAGDCTPAAGNVIVDDLGLITSAPCDGTSRFSYQTVTQTTDAQRTYVFSQQSTTAGAVSVTGRWSREAAPLTLSNVGVQGGAFFGDAVAVDGNTVIVGAPFDDGAGTDAGAVYIYTYEEGVWSTPTTLRPDSPRVGERFGEDVAFANGIAIVGGDGTAAGRVYAFTYSGGSWSQVTYFQEGGVAFGNRVAFDGSVLAVRSAETVGGLTNAGAVYVYHYAAGSWSRYGRIVSTTPTQNGVFGFRIEVADGWLLALAHSPDAPHLFHFADGSWVHHTGSADFPELAPPLPYTAIIYNAASMVGDRFAIVYPASNEATIFKRTANVWQLEEDFAGVASMLHSAVGIRGDDAILTNDSTPRVLLHYRFDGGSWVQRTSHGLTDQSEISECVIGPDRLVACTSETSQRAYVLRLPIN